MEITEKSKITLEVDGRIVDQTFHDSNDAWEKGMNLLAQGAKKAIIKETVTIEWLPTGVIPYEKAIAKGREFLNALAHDGKIEPIGTVRDAKVDERHPNFFWQDPIGSKLPQEGALPPLRLCWIISFSCARTTPYLPPWFEIWLDAYSGEVVGGYHHIPR